jgi:hypothetical protein
VEDGKKAKPKLVDVAQSLEEQSALEDLFSSLTRLRQEGIQGVSSGLLSQYLSGLEKFGRQFALGASDPDRFMSMTDIESLVTDLLESQKALAKEMAWEKARALDQEPLLEKKKRELSQLGLKVRKWRKFPRTIVTLFGKFQFDRFALIGSSPEDKRQMAEQFGSSMIFPLDEALGVDRLPFKISVEAMLEIAHWVQEIPSYQASARALLRNTQVDVREDTIRAVANHIGSLVFEADKIEAERVWASLQSAQIEYPLKTQDHVLYLEVDGAMVHTRKKPISNEPVANIIEDSGQSGEKKSIWMENKLGMIFNSKDFEWWFDKNGKKQHSIGKREYVAYLGGVEEFKKLFFAAAMRNHYGLYNHTILISDGATWVRHMKEKLFPDAQQILDLYHLCENVSKFSKIAFKDDESKYKPWSKEVCNLFKESNHKDAIKAIKAIKTKSAASAKQNFLAYIDNNIKNIDYAAYKANGWYVGSGAIESANKTVLQFRLKQAGMRWCQENGQYIVSLMAKSKSNLWGKDVAERVRDKYEIGGASELLGLPSRPERQHDSR